MVTVLLCPQIQEGMVVYVCFFHGATEDVTHQMGNTSFYSAGATVAKRYDNLVHIPQMCCLNS